MRLICPNCDAQYEVDASAIPPAGRDVQCSNCGHAWYQDAEPAAEDPAAPLYRAPEPDHDDVAVPEAIMQSDADEDEEAPPPSSQFAPPPKRSLDESVLTVLREEAARETAARRAEAGSLEMQGDLGLPPPVPLTVGAAATASGPMTDTEKRVAALKGEPVPPPKPAARRDLLPDIEEINSTLSPSPRTNLRPAHNDNRGGDSADDLPDLTDGSEPRSGFRSGFVLMLVLAGLAAAVYLMAPQISQQLPGLTDPLTTYVAAVDAARVWLDGLIRQATGALNGLTGNAG
jgi:predicted Zn finger-like uncharacterized protein